MLTLLATFLDLQNMSHLLRTSGREGSSLAAIVFIAIGLLIVRIALIANKPSPPTGHWHHHFENFNYSPLAFYKTIADSVKAKAIPGLELREVVHSEGGTFSMKRQYLRFTRNKLIFDICAAPFAKGFFVSWWQAKMPTNDEVLFRVIPFFGKRIVRNKRAQTYFELDTEIMFKDGIHQSVLEAIDALTTEKGLRKLSPSERIITTETAQAALG